MKSWKNIGDMSNEDWAALDFELEKYDRAGKTYDLSKCKRLAFVFRQIHQEPMNFFEVPDIIRNKPQFQNLAALCNKRLETMLFPTRTPNILANVRLMRGATGLGTIECKKLLEKFGNLIDAVDYARQNSDEPQYEGLTEGRFDVLDKENVIFSCKKTEEFQNAGYNPWEYHIRAVDSVGRYVQLH